MDWREFAASLVGSLAWPGAITVLVLVLREQIKELLRGPMSRLAVGPFEVTWDRTVEATKEQLEPAPGVRDGGMELPPGGIVADLWQLTEVAPSAAVVEGYKRIEEALTRRLGGIMDEVPRRPARQLARLAYQRGLITGETVRAIEGLSVLRNLSAHGRRDGAEVTSAEAAEYLGLVETVLYTISTWIKPDDPDA